MAVGLEAGSNGSSCAGSTLASDCVACICATAGIDTVSSVSRAGVLEATGTAHAGTLGSGPLAVPEPHPAPDTESKRKQSKVLLLMRRPRERAGPGPTGRSPPDGTEARGVTC